MNRRSFLKKLIVACVGIPAAATPDRTSGAEHFLRHGYRFEDFMKTGYFYAPYIPFYVTPVLATKDLVSRKGFLAKGEEDD